MQHQAMRVGQRPVVQRFCRGLSVCSQNRKYWRDGKEHIAYCFTTRAEAEFVQMHFCGEFVDPKTLGQWPRVNGGRSPNRTAPDQ